jgi:lipopolysaccharide biosynthesis glycosyltransferase
MAFNIVASCDNDFAQHTCVMLASLLFHHPEQSFKIFILVSPTFSQENRNNIVSSLSAWASKIQFLSVGELEVSGLKVDGHISSATYYRLYLHELLPCNVKTALYLDSDIIINGSILELLNTDISNYSLAAVPDAWIDQNQEIRCKICLNEEARYLNGGVLLLNLERWRSEEIGPRALEFCASNPDRITYHDQCAVNHIVQGKFFVLDRKWNFQVEHMTRVSEYKFHPGSRREASSAAIIHFTSQSKPWQFMCTHPMKELYFKYLELTTWRGFKERDRTLPKMIKKYLRIHAPSTSRRVEAMHMIGKRFLRI